MELVRLTIDKLDNTSTGSGAFLLILKEAEVKNPRLIPIVIGAFEAQAIIFGLEKKFKPPRPITHDLFYKVLTHLGYHLEKVIINKFEEGIFFAQLVLKKGEEIHYFDSRTSDAVALAVRFNAPIYAAKKVVEDTGVYVAAYRKKSPENDLLEEIFDMLESDSPGDEPGENPPSGLENKIIFLLQKALGIDYNKARKMDETEINEHLQKAIENEEYEKAAQLRDVLNLIKEKNNESPDDRWDEA